MGRAAESNQHRFQPLISTLTTLFQIEALREWIMTRIAVLVIYVTSAREKAPST
jgi:hypothetical protein